MGSNYGETHVQLFFYRSKEFSYLRYEFLNLQLFTKASFIDCNGSLVKIFNDCYDVFDIPS